MHSKEIWNLIQTTPPFLVEYLGRVLPEVGGGRWWETHVLGYLSETQQQRIKRDRITSLAQLDLSALLSVGIGASKQLIDHQHLTYEGRDVLHKLRKLRNMYAHPAVDAPAPTLEETYRMLDRLHEDMVALGMPSDRLPPFEAARAKALKALVDALAPPQQPQPPIVIEVPVAPKGIDFAAEPGLQIGAFKLQAADELFELETTDFGNTPIEATAIPRRIVGNSGFECTLHLLIIDRPKSEGEYGQVFCQSRGASPEIWDAIVKRLRMGLRLHGEDSLVMDLRCAQPSPDGYPTRKELPLEQISSIIGMDVVQTLKVHGALAVGTRAEIIGDTGRRRNCPAVLFKRNDSDTPALAWILCTLLPLAKEAPFSAGTQPR